MARSGTGIEVGRATVKLMRGHVSGNTFVVTQFGVAPNPGGELATGWGALAPFRKPKNCRVGLTGRDVNVRYTRVPRLPDWQLRKLMRFEAEEVGGQSESEVASDFNVLPEIPEIEGEDVVLLAMVRESLLEQHVDGLASLGGVLDAFTPNAIAVYNAFLSYGVVMEDTVLIANLGADNIDVVLVRGGDLLFARNMTGGARLFDEAIAERFQIDVTRAESYKVEAGTLNTQGPFADANAEKACRALQAPAGQILSLLQSAVLFCKNQIKLSSLKLDRVLLCGGGAALEGLPAYLSKGLGVPVELFDPFVVVDASKLDPQSAQLLDEHRLEAVVALGLACSASDPDAYSIEILPERLRKRRDFLRGPAWLIAAAAVLLGYIGLSTWKQKNQLSSLEREVATLDAQYRRARKNDLDTRGLIEENAALESYATQLFHLAGSGEQLVRSLAAVERHLPEGFWIDSLASEWGWDDELEVERGREQPILRVEGRTREGTDAPALAFEEMVEGMRAELDGLRLEHRMGDAGSLFTLDLTTLAPAEQGEQGEQDTDEGVDADPLQQGQG